MNLKELNKIGLTHEGSKNTAEKLNELLANYQLFYMNVRGLHWNIKGKDFFVLHEKFEELYNGSLENIDEVAERILTLGVTPLHSYKAYTKISKIEEVENVFDSVSAVNTVLDGLRQLLIIEREILAVASKINDEGTVSLMSDYITEQEKLVWMFSAVVAK